MNMIDMIQIGQGRYVSILEARPFVIMVPMNDRPGMIIGDIVNEEMIVIGNVVGPADRGCFKTIYKQHGRNVFVVDQTEAEIEIV